MTIILPSVAAVQHQHSPAAGFLHVVCDEVTPDAVVGIRVSRGDVNRHEVGGVGHVEPMTRVVEQTIDSRR